MVAVEWLDWVVFFALVSIVVLSTFSLVIRLIGRRTRSANALIGDCSDLCMGLGMVAMGRPFGISFPIAGSIVFGAFCGWSLGAAWHSRRFSGETSLRGIGTHAGHLAGNATMVFMSVGMAGAHAHHGGGLSGSDPGLALVAIVAAAGFATGAMVTALGVGGPRLEACGAGGVLTGTRVGDARRIVMNVGMAYMLVRML